MPRKKKIEELSSWVSCLKAFGCNVIYPSYKLTACILADDDKSAIYKAKQKYPDAIIELNNIFNRIIV